MFISNESVSDEYMVDWGERLGCGMNGSVRSAKSRSTGDDFAVKVRETHHAAFEGELRSLEIDHELERKSKCMRWSWATKMLSSFMKFSVTNSR